MYLVLTEKSKLFLYFILKGEIQKAYIFVLVSTSHVPSFMLLS